MPARAVALLAVVLHQRRQVARQGLQQLGAGRFVQPLVRGAVDQVRAEDGELLDDIEPHRPVRGVEALVLERQQRLARQPVHRHRQGARGLARRPRGLALVPLAGEADHAGGGRRLAESEGFEPSVRLLAQRFSRPSRSTAPATLHLIG